MSELTRIIGTRIHNYRLQAGLTQEGLADKAECHPTYIGQVECGDKNLTVESLFKIANALGIPMECLLEKLGRDASFSSSLPLEAYELIASKPLSEQEQLLVLLKEIDKYRSL